MSFEFEVHAATDTTVSRVVTLNGTEIPATVGAFQVELVSTSPNGGTYTHRFIGSEVEAARAKYIPGTKITLDHVDASDATA